MSIINFLFFLFFIVFIFVIGIFSASWVLSGDRNYTNVPRETKVHPSVIINETLRRTNIQEKLNEPLSLEKLQDEEKKKEEKNPPKLEKIKTEVIMRGKMPEAKKPKENSSMYSDPVEAICKDTRVDCSPENKNCFLGSGHLDFNSCMEKARIVQSNIDNHNNKFPPKDTRRKNNIKYISWAPGGLYEGNLQPQCMLFDDTASVITGEKGWQTYVKNPEYFTMTQNPNIYMVENKCPCEK